MTLTHRLLAASLATLLFCSFVNAQQTVSQQAATVPRLVNFSGRKKFPTLAVAICANVTGECALAGETYIEFGPKYPAEDRAVI
jgi:hypothetical protein